MINLREFSLHRSRPLDCRPRNVIRGRAPACRAIAAPLLLEGPPTDYNHKRKLQEPSLALVRRDFPELEDLVRDGEDPRGSPVVHCSL
jgi:hypothetical protein